MSAFEVQDFQKENLRSLKGLKYIFLGLWVLLTGLWALKDTLHLRQNRSNWL